MAETPGPSVSPTRRTVFAAAGGAGLAAVLTACGSDSGSGSAAGAPSSDAPTSDMPSSAPSDTGTPSASSSFGAAGGAPLGKTADIPVGGGKVFADQKVVVTQPTAGHFKGFSAVCTHRSCTVAEVTGGTINCPCHGSKFHIADGSVAHGPATQALPSQSVTVSGGTVSLA
ncbi:Rieske (2Fe-2S) protein [Actinacidiphila paucisporea]|uniref:Ferredoxin subunit of nitrite reductase or a ring-hydroxylating dioxygenase n=1 Tax=Actinacidiphila paucisporea TaxID=310782 RepID=A0A1M7GNB8_9ACTN|nr:Rieske (2Fe-2S) protein [Actinacidiphila paucisporea]SHM17671.1 Ferredoxin subunit of nitrite reductase or a ring-hydroxylating dioxygenase [Actinacidiphila paucisporea]